MSNDEKQDPMGFVGRADEAWQKLWKHFEEHMLDKDRADQQAIDAIRQRMHMHFTESGMGANVRSPVMHIPDEYVAQVKPVFDGLKEFNLAVIHRLFVELFNLERQLYKLRLASEDPEDD